MIARETRALGEIGHTGLCARCDRLTSTARCCDVVPIPLDQADPSAVVHALLTPRFAWRRSGRGIAVVRGLYHAIGVEPFWGGVTCVAANALRQGRPGQFGGPALLEVTA
jgi:hypothetical protein